MTLGDRLLSRKFWMALGAVVALFTVRAYGEVAQIVIAYLAVQAGVDALATYQQNRMTAPPTDSSEPVVADGEYEGASTWTGSVT